MGRGGKVRCKRVAGRKKKDYEDDDEDDENYVAEEDSSPESDASNEANFDVSEDNDSSANFSTSEEDLPNNEPKPRKCYYSGHRSSVISDYEESEEDDYEDDEDFSPNTNDDCEEDSLVIVGVRDSYCRGAAKQGKRKLKKRISKPKVTRRSRKVVATPAKRKRRRVAACSDDDDFFIAKDSPSVRKSCRKSSKVKKNTVKHRSTKKKASPINSVSFDPDFIVSDDDLSSEDQVSMNKSKNKRRIKHGRRNKVNSETSDSDFALSDKEIIDCDLVGLARPRKICAVERKNVRTSRKMCVDFDGEVSEKNIKDLESERASKLVKHERPVGKKGKEKEADDSVQLCGICLSEEHNWAIQGILNCCSHYFCFACIMEWSKVESRCPLCKGRFATITKFSRSNPMLEMRRPVIRVQMRDQVYQPSEEELRVLLDPYENVVCMECHRGGEDNLMLLCDICDSSAHTYCVGLGNEVPEGNWYCECCKLADEGSLNSQVLDTQEASSSHMPNGGIEENISRNFRSTFFQRSAFLQGQSSQGFDLNETPRSFVVDDGAVHASQASTLSGRRAIQRRIRFYFSNSRESSLYVEPSRADTGQPVEVVHSVQEQNGEQLLTTERPNSLHRVLDQQENKRNFACSNSNSIPCSSNEGGDFRRVDGAKDQVQSVVKTCLKRLSREVPLERSAFKKITKKATHTILAACGIHHSRSKAFLSPIQPPEKCRHDLVDSGPINLVRGCCCSCFNYYVKDMVRMLVETL